MMLFSSLQSTSSIGPLLGTAWREEVYVSVRWGWLAFLAVELVLAGAFILATIIAHRYTSTGRPGSEELGASCVIGSR